MIIIYIILRMNIICNIDAHKSGYILQVAYLKKIRFNKTVLKINPKKFKEIKNKTIPSPLRPKFRKKTQANIYFLSQRKFNGEKKTRLIKNIRLFSALSIILIGGYFLTN